MSNRNSFQETAFFRLCLLFSFFACSALFAQQAPPQQASAEESEIGVNAMILIGAPNGEPLSGDELDQFTEEVASSIRCPQCQGLSIADSSAKTARAMKGELKELLAQGYDREQAFTYFEKSYGEFIRLEPKAEGFNLVVWIAPVIGLMVGIAFLTMRFRSVTGGPGEETAAAEPTRSEAAGSAEAEDVVAEAEESSADEQGEAEADDELAAYRDRVRREIAS